MNDTLVGGIDIGGSHITVGLVDLKKSILIDTSLRRESVNSHQNAEEIIKRWTAVIKESFQSVNTIPSQIAISMPGPFDYNKGVCLIKDQGKYEALFGLNIKELLSQSLSISVDDILIINDALCFLKGEIFVGAAKDFTNVMGLMLGTGFGTSRYINGEVTDANLWCSPFKNGIAEDFFSTRSFLKKYNELANKNISGVKELAQKAAADKYAKMVFSEFGKNLAEFLYPYLKEQQPEMVVLGGNISRAYPHFIKELTGTLQQKSIKIKIKKSKLGENAALIGAASFTDVYLKLRYAS